jgi:hypothetical protein
MPTSGGLRIRVHMLACTACSGVPLSKALVANVCHRLRGLILPSVRPPKVVGSRQPEPSWAYFTKSPLSAFKVQD